MKTREPDQRPNRNVPAPDFLGEENANDAAIGGASNQEYETSIDDGRLGCDIQEDIGTESDAKEGL